MNKTVKIIGVLAIAAGLSACSIPNTQPDEIFVHRGGGPFEDKDYKECIEPASRQVESAFDSYFAYPFNRRVYDFTGSVKDGSDGDRFTVVSKDGITLTIPGTISFNLNTKCEVLKAFDKEVGGRYKAYMDKNDDGIYETGAGWLQVLNIYFRPSLDATLDRVAKNYTWDQLRSDLSIKDELNKAVNADLPARVKAQIGGDYFLGITANILQPIAPGDLVKQVEAQEVAERSALTAQATAEANAITTQKTAEANAAAAKLAAEAQVAQKQAELRVARLDAEIQRQLIASYGGPTAYNNFKAIEKGLNPLQPTYGGQTLVQP